MKRMQPALMREYAAQQLFYLPGGPLWFSNRLIDAQNAISHEVLEDGQACADFRCVLLNNLFQKSETFIHHYKKLSQNRLCGSVKPKNVVERPLEQLRKISSEWMALLVCNQRFCETLLSSVRFWIV